jgi:hypothetical protein
MTAPHRARLPNRRPAITQDIVVSNTTLSASIGFDETGRSAEIFFKLAAQVIRATCAYRLCHPNVVPMETAEPSD